MYSYSDIVWSCCVFHSVSTCRQIWWALDSLHGREYEWHSHTFARESSAIWEITLEQVIIDAKAATAHMHMHKIRHQDAYMCPATSIIQSLEAENVFVLSLSSGSVIKPEPHDFRDVNWRHTSENASFHLFYFSNTYLAAVNITSQQEWRPYPLSCLGWSLLWSYGVLWKWSRGLLLIINFLTKMNTQDVCQHWEGASQPNTDTSGQKSPRLKHGPTPVLSNWLS